jgi:hypothetical protein
MRDILSGERLEKETLDGKRQDSREAITGLSRSGVITSLK